LKFETSYNPLSWRKRYNLMKGSTHGLCHTLAQLAYFRPHNRHANYHNLYFVGASTHPGTGVPTALVSARLTAERVLEESGCVGVGVGVERKRRNGILVDRRKGNALDSFSLAQGKP
jgi:hypothetical protein